MRQILRWACCTLIAMSTSGVCEPLPAKNLKFEAWDDTKTKPAHWWVGSPDDFRLSAECANPSGSCVVKLRNIPDGKGTMRFVPVSQWLPASLAPGHVWKLSGRIRTEGVTGWAGFWMRVDAAPREMISLDNMQYRGPRGTTDWQRFEVSQAVPEGASQVVFGLILSGAGAAWFDDLSLEVDRKSVVPVYKLLTRPPRPVPDKALLDDAALMLPREDRPKVKDAWREDVAKRAKAIRSLFSDDFSDLQFLKPILGNARIVQLGESGHGVAEFNWMKVRLIKFLHREVGFDVIAFESPLGTCELADERLASASADAVMRDCLYQVWHSTETLGLFEYLQAARKAGERLSLSGFDVQKNSGRGQQEAGARLKAMAAAIDPALGARFSAAEKTLEYRPGGNDALTVVAAEYVELAGAFATNRAKLEAGFPARTIEIAIQELRSRAAFARQLAAAGVESFRTRDRGMADNLDFLADKLYAGRKIVVWAHNSHIAKAREGKIEPTGMGEWIAQRRKPGEVYTIGLYMGRGMAGQNDRRLYEIAPPEADTLDAVLANAGMRMSFVDLTKAAQGPSTEWIFGSMRQREWGRNPGTMVPAQTFDGLIYIDRVTPPEYL